MKLKLSSDYGFKPTPEQLEAIRKHDPSASVYPEDHQYEYDRGRLKGHIKADPAQLLSDPQLVSVRWIVISTELDANVYTSILSQLEQITEKMGRYTGPRADDLVRPGYAEAQQYNERCHVHVPNLGLLLIDEVRVVEDYCSNDLQEELDEGWRILAVCPQPDQRRPDYILGRTKK